MRANERTEERMALYCTRRFHSTWFNTGVPPQDLLSSHPLLFFCLQLLSSLISHVMSCMVQHGHFPKKSLAEILYRAEIVVWGKNLRHYMPNPKLPVENSEFQVYCVYKVSPSTSVKHDFKGEIATWVVATCSSTC